MTYCGLGEEPKPSPTNPKSMPDAPTAKGSPATKKAPAPTKVQIRAQAAKIEKLIGDEAMKWLESKTQAKFKDLTSSQKKSLITTSAIDAGISIALLAIPVAGWVLSAIYSVVMAVVRGITGGQLNRRAQRIIAEAQQEAMVMENLFNVKIQKEQARVIREETPDAIKLAIVIMQDQMAKQEAQQANGEVQGLGFWAAFAAYAAANPSAVKAMTAAQTQMAKAASAGLKQGTQAIQYNWQQALKSAQAGQENFIKTWEENQRYLEEQWGLREKEDDEWYDKAGNEIESAIKSIGSGIESALHKVGNALEDGADYVSGHVVVTKAKQAAAQALHTARVQQMMNWSKAKKQLNNPEFRAQLRKQIALQVLSNESTRSMIIKALAYKQLAEGKKKVTTSISAPTESQPIQPITTSSTPKRFNAKKLAVGGGLLAMAIYFLSK